MSHTESMASPAAEALAPSPPKRLRTLSPSRMATARTCLKLYFYRYILGVAPVLTSDAIRFGRLFHLGLEMWWRAAATGGNAIVAAIQAVRAEAASRAEPTDPFDLVRAEELLFGYNARWGEEKFEVLGVEEEFTTPMLNPATSAESRTWLLHGRLDARVRATDGLVRVLEHKTTSEDPGPGSEYWKRLRMDGQATAYHLGSSALGEPAAGAIYDVIRKPGIRPYKATPLETRDYTKGKPCKVQHHDCNVCIEAGDRGLRPCHAECQLCNGSGWHEAPRLKANQREADETPDEFRARLREDIAANPDRYYQRGEVVRLEDELREGMADIWMIGQIIREAERLERWPRNPGACIQYGRTCDFFSVCSREASIEDTSKYMRASEAASNASPSL